MADIDTLARNLIAGAGRLADRGALLALSVAFVTAVVAVSAYLTGLAALDGGSRSAWFVIGGTLVVLVVGAPLVARQRLRRLRRDATVLFEEVRSLLTGNSDARRVVIDIEEAESGSQDGIRRGAPGTSLNPAVMAQSQRYGEFRRIAVSANLTHLPVAMRALATFPALLAIALAGILLFGFLGFVFLLVWAF